MRLGKVKESILKRSVLRQLHKNTGRSPGLVEDAGIMALPGENVAVAVSVNPVEGWTMAAQRIVFGAVNSLAAAGASPESLAVVVLMPPGTEEKRLKALMEEIGVYCAKEGLILSAGHTAVSPAVKDLVVSITAVGIQKELPTAEKKARAEILRQPEANRDIVVMGTVGREGAAMLAREREEELLTRYPSFFIEEAKRLFDDGSMKAAADLAREEGAVYLHDSREGGIFGGLWELAAAGKVGLNIDLKRIPIRQHTIEVCEFFHLNPYMLRSGGTLLAVCRHGDKVVNALGQKGFSAAIIGRTTEGKDRIIRYDDEIRFLEPPKEDEYYQAAKMK